MAEMAPEYAAKYFVSSGNGFEPTKELRDLVTFARQDISVDPPFLRLDLVTCRNVMIYFNTELQAKVLSILRYSLRDDGLLFLGRSETVIQQEALFSSVDRRARIFRRAARAVPSTWASWSGGSSRFQGPSTEAPKDRASAFSCVLSPTISARRC